MLAFSAWRHNLITLTSAHPLPVLIPVSTGCSGMQDNPTKVKTGKKTIIHSIACLDNIVMEVLSQQLIWIQKANWVRTSDCIINSEREVKHFLKTASEQGFWLEFLSLFHLQGEAPSLNLSLEISWYNIRKVLCKLWLMGCLQGEGCSVGLF